MIQDVGDTGHDQPTFLVEHKETSIYSLGFYKGFKLLWRRWIHIAIGMTSVDIAFIE